MLCIERVRVETDKWMLCECTLIGFKGGARVELFVR